MYGRTAGSRVEIVPRRCTGHESQHERSTENKDEICLPLWRRNEGHRLTRMVAGLLPNCSVWESSTGPMYRYPRRGSVSM